MTTYLYSELSKRSWGETAGIGGPIPPSPLMIPTRVSRKRVRTKTLIEATLKPRLKQKRKE